MKALKYIFTISIILTSISIFSQTRTITGVVTGIDGALEGVKVELKNEKLTVQTNESGQYSIEIPNEDRYLIFSLKGMNNSVFVTENMNKANITLIPTDKKLYRLILNKESLLLCDIFIKNYENSKHFSEVKSLREKYFFIEAYQIAAAKFSDTALQNYLRVYPNGKYTEKVKDAIEVAAWQKARHEDTIDSYKEYLSTYPNGKAASLANRMIAEKE